MALKGLVRYIGLVAVAATFLFGFAGPSPTSVGASTVVATIVSGGGGGPPGSPDPAVEFLTPSNVWQPAVVFNAAPFTPPYATPFSGSQWIDVPPTAAAPPPPVVVFRTKFTLPTGCTGPTISVQLYADNWADVYLNGPSPAPLPAAVNTFGGQPHLPNANNFDGTMSWTFTDPPGPSFINPGLNWLYIVVENFGGPPDPASGNPRALDFAATVACDQVVTAPPPTLVYECFQLNLGQDPNKTVMLDTANFGKDVVTARTSDVVCESALKYRQVPSGTAPAPPTVRDVMQCFRLQLGQDPNDPAVLDTANFGPDSVSIRTSTHMCESAVKVVNGQTSGSLDPTHVWQCFNVEDGQNPNAQVILSTNNFGPHHAIVGQAVMMCEMATKTTAAGVVFNQNNDGQVFECFRLLDTPSQNVTGTLITKNFGNDDVRIRRANLMCEPAKKTILFTNPNPNGPVPGVPGEEGETGG